MTRAGRRRRTLVLTALVLAVATAAAGCDTSTEETVGPGEETTTTVPQAPNPYYGGPQVDAEPNPLGLKWSWKRVAIFTDALTEVAGGATFYEVDWCEVEPTPGARDLTQTDQIVDAAHRMGYELYLKLRVGSCWVTGSADVPVQGGPKQPSSMPLDLAAYDTWVGDMVRHYSERDVDVYAIENEVNTRNQWAGTPGEYADLLARGSAAVRGAGTGARVADSGLASIAYGTVLASDLMAAGKPAEALAAYRSFYARRFREGGGGRYPDMDGVDELRRYLADEEAVRTQAYFDATVASAAAFDVFQLHMYEPVENLPAVVALVRGRLPGKEIQGWELGISWPSDDFDADVAAAETVRLLAGALALGIPRGIYLPEAFSPEARENEIWRGLWEPDGTPRPAATAYQVLVEATSGSDLVFRPVTAGLASGLGIGAEGAATLVLWSAPGSTVPVAVAAVADGAEVTDMMGREIEPIGGRIMVGEAPVYVRARVDLDAAVAAIGGTP